MAHRIDSLIEKVLGDGDGEQSGLYIKVEFAPAPGPGGILNPGAVDMESLARLVVLAAQGGEIPGHRLMINGIGAT